LISNGLVLFRDGRIGLPDFFGTVRPPGDASSVFCLARSSTGVSAGDAFFEGIRTNEGDIFLAKCVEEGASRSDTVEAVGSFEVSSCGNWSSRPSEERKPTPSPEA